MHILNARTRSSKLYSQRLYNIPIYNDQCHQSMLQDKTQQQRIVYQKKQMQKTMHSIIKERMFSNFIQQNNRISLENYIQLEDINRQTVNRRIKNIRNKTLKTIDTTNQQYKTIRNSVDNNRTTNFFYNTPNKQFQTIRSKTFSKKGSNFKDAESQMGFSFPTLTLERRNTNTNREARDNGQQIFHTKKLVINEKNFVEFFRKLVGATPTQIVYDFKLTREILCNRYKNVIEPKILQRFFHFFGFPMQFGFRQYLTLLENAANANLRFIYFWVFLQLDENGNGVLTYQDFFKVLQKFRQNAYIENEVYELVRWLEKIKFQPTLLDSLFQESLAANQNLKLEELKELMKQAPKERIDVNCVKNTCYHQTVLSLEHEHSERQKINQIETAEATTKQLKLQMLERKKKIEHENQLRLRDFYLIFKAKRPKIFCFILQLLANVNPQDYE